MSLPRGSLARPALAVAFAASTLLAAPPATEGAQVCGGPQLEPGDHLDRMLTVDGQIREYDVHVPASYDGSLPVPLVLDLHGISSTKEEQASRSGFKAKSDQAGFVIAYPQALSISIQGPAWNAGFCCGSQDDVGFAKAIVGAVDDVVNIDHSRVYATGLSLGGAMSHWLACQAADVFAATAPVSHPVYADFLFRGVSTCGFDVPARPISIDHFHGLGDAVVPYDGADFFPFFPPARDSFNYWAQVNGCAGSPTITFDNGAGSICETFTNCQDGVRVELCSLEGEHVLYGNEVLDIADRAWDFLRQARLPLPDRDLDEIPDQDDNCPTIANADQADSDGDCLGDACDNCTEIPNGPVIPGAGDGIQVDTNGDGYGNACDPDLNNDGTVDFLDLGLLKAVFFTDDADADLNGDGTVDFLDLGLMKSGFFQPPGPSGLACAGTIPCP